MKRLTRWNGNRYLLPQGKNDEGESNWRIIADRLAGYENAGLTPEGVAWAKHIIMELLPESAIPDNIFLT